MVTVAVSRAALESFSFADQPVTPSPGATVTVNVSSASTTRSRLTGMVTSAVVASSATVTVAGTVPRSSAIVAGEVPEAAAATVNSTPPAGAASLKVTVNTALPPSAAVAVEVIW